MCSAADLGHVQNTEVTGGRYSHNPNILRSYNLEERHYPPPPQVSIHISLFSSLLYMSLSRAVFPRCPPRHSHFSITLTLMLFIHYFIPVSSSSFGVIHVHCPIFILMSLLYVF